MEKIEIAPQEKKPKIELSDSDFALYQTLQELIEAIKELSRKISILRGVK